MKGLKKNSIDSILKIRREKPYTSIIDFLSRIDIDKVERGDIDADLEGMASVSCLPSWPQTHPLEMDVDLLAWSLDNSPEGLPIWLK